MEQPLRILTNKDPRRHLIKLFNDAYKEITKAENPLPYGACMKAMQGFFKFVDEETGEIVIEYPNEEAWTGQIEGLKRDKFSIENRLCGFPYFLKRFGSFKPVNKTLRRAGFRCQCGQEFWTAEEYNKHICLANEKQEDDARDIKQEIDKLTDKFKL